MWARIKDLLLHNLGLKLASLLLALLLYAHVVTDQQRESRLTIPLALTGLPDSLAVSGHVPSRVTVDVRGKWKDLIRLGLIGRQLTVDLAGVSPGRFQKSISADDVRERAIPAELAKAVDVTDVIEPRTVDVMVEAKRRRSVPLLARLVGTPADGYELVGDPEVEPDSAVVAGPQSVVENLDTLRTLPVDIAGERERIQRQVQLDTGASPIVVQPRRVLVTLRIARTAPDSMAHP
jgi:YbbR domain-containing protein